MIVKEDFYVTSLVFNSVSGWSAELESNNFKRNLSLVTHKFVSSYSKVKLNIDSTSVEDFKPGNKFSVTFTRIENEKD
jgi:hypothetical protein